MSFTIVKNAEVCSRSLGSHFLIVCWFQVLGGGWLQGSQIGASAHGQQQKRLLSIHEHHAMSILRDNGVSVPKYEVATTAQQAFDIANNFGTQACSVSTRINDEPTRIFQCQFLVVVLQLGRLCTLKTQMYEVVSYESKICHVHHRPRKTLGVDSQTIDSIHLLSANWSIGFTGEYDNSYSRWIEPRTRERCGTQPCGDDCIRILLNQRKGKSL